MENRTGLYVAIVFAMIGIVVLCICFMEQPQTDNHYYNALIVSEDPHTLYTQDVNTDDVEARISVSKADSAGLSWDKYKLTVVLSNRTERQYEYEITLSGYSSSLICDTSKSEIAYSENYSNGNKNNAKTIYYFVPDNRNREIGRVGVLSFMLEENDSTASMGVVEIKIDVFSPNAHKKIESITQQLYFDFV